MVVMMVVLVMMIMVARMKLIIVAMTRMVMITCVVADIMMRMRKRIATSDNASRCSSCN